MTTGNIKFSQLPNLPAANITAATIAPVVENNTNYKVTLANLTSYINNGGNITATTISASGNITGDYFIGDGSQLTNLPTSPLAGTATGDIDMDAYALRSGLITSTSTSSPYNLDLFVTTNYAGYGGGAGGAVYLGTENGPTAEAQANISVGSSCRIKANVIGVYLGTTTSVSGDVYATGVYHGDGSGLSNVSSTLPSTFTVTGNIVGGNLSATGNVTGNYILGNGSQLTGLPSTYSNAQVATYLASGNVTSNIITTGNITGAVHIGSGAALTNLPAANIVGTVANATYATTAGTATSATTAANATYATTAGTATSATTATTATSATTATTAVTVTSASQPAITSVGTLTSLSVSGNVTANYFVGNGSALTGITASAGNSIVSGNSFANVAVANGKVWINGGNTIGYYNLANVTGLQSNTMIITNGASNAYVTLAGSGDIVLNPAQSGVLSTGNVYLSTLRIQSRSLTNAADGTFSGTVDTNALTVNANAVVYGTLSVSGKTTLGPYVQTVVTVGNTSTSITPNASTAPVLKFTANNNFTLNVPSNMTAGQSLTMIFTQDATGNRVMTANTAYKFAYGVNTLSTTASSTDVLTVFYDGTNYLTNLIKGYA